VAIAADSERPVGFPFDSEGSELIFLLMLCPRLFSADAEVAWISMLVSDCNRVTGIHVFPSSLGHKADKKFIDKVSDLCDSRLIPIDHRGIR
jgi:hypothetical protein